MTTAESSVASATPNVGFLRVGSGGLVESVTQRLTEAVRIGYLSPGEQLPPEAALARQLDVSTVTLREALAVLRSRGLIETKRGRNGGSFVCERGSTTAAVLRARLGDVAVADLRDIGDEWLAVFPMSAMLAARRADAAGLDRMYRLVESLPHEKSLDGRARTLSKFHVEVALASQSERLTRAELRLQSEIGDIFWTPMPKSPEGEVEVSKLSDECGELVASIREEDAARSRAVAETRVQGAMDRLIAMALELHS